MNSDNCSGGGGEGQQENDIDAFFRVLSRWRCCWLSLTAVAAAAAYKIDGRS